MKCTFNPYSYGDDDDECACEGSEASFPFCLCFWREDDDDWGMERTKGLNPIEASSTWT